MGTGELLGKPDEMLRGGGGVALGLDTSCDGNWDKLWLFGPKGFSTDKCYAFTLLC